MECGILPPVSAMDEITIYSLVAINICTAVLTVLVNYCFIIGIVTSPNLHTPTNIFITSLSVSDFLVGLIVQPLACVMMLMHISGNSHCVLEYLVFISLSIFCGASGLCVPVISLDRYIRMKKLQYYMKYVNKKRACLAIGCIWVNALAFAFAPFYGIRQDVFYITLMVYLFGCIVIMAAAYRSVVQRSVVLGSRRLKTHEKHNIIYTRKTALDDGDQTDSGHFRMDSLQQPATLNPNVSTHGPDCPKTNTELSASDADVESSDAFRPENGQRIGAIALESNANPEERRCLGNSENSRQVRITVTVCLLVAVIIVSWMPTFVFSLIWSLDKKRMNSNELVVTLHYIALTFGFSCSCVNPLLYCSRIREVRKSATNVFWKTFKCF